MKKVISLVLSLLLFLSLLPSVHATNTELSSLSPTEHFVLYNPEGNRLDVLIYQSLIESQAEVYKDGLLIQQAVANKQTMTVQSEIYDLPNESNSFNNQNTSFSKEMGFTVITQHKAQSTNSLNLVIPFSTRSSLWNEPVENSGLSSSPYGDGYYLIGTDELTVHPGIIGYLYSKYTKTYDGETAYWTFDVYQTMAAIAAIISASACASIAGALLTMLVFTSSEYLAYRQALRVETYTFNYTYRVRVNGSIQLTSYRDTTYWKSYNTTEKTTRWDEKSFNGGFGGSNSELVSQGIQNYVNSHS